MTQDKPRQFPNLEDRNRIQKLHGVTGPTAVIAERAKVDPKYAAIELRAMTYRREAKRIKAKNPAYRYVWEVE